MIRYKKEVRSTYRLGRVIEVHAGIDGIVRKVTLQYRLPSEKSYRYVDHPVHGIAVIVPVEEQTSASNAINEKRALNPKAPKFYPSNNK